MQYPGLNTKPDEQVPVPSWKHELEASHHLQFGAAAQGPQVVSVLQVMSPPVSMPGTSGMLGVSIVPASGMPPSGGGATPQPSSTEPLQLSSTPLLQISACGSTWPRHARCQCESEPQDCTPSRHTPTPRVARAPS